MSLIDSLFRPLTGRTFLETHWGVRVARFRPDWPLASDDALTSEAWRRLPALEYIDAAGRDGQDQHTQVRVRREDIAAVLERGDTVCADLTHHAPVVRVLSDLQRALGLGVGGFAKLYASPPGAGFPLHLDPHHVFVLQCQGEKRWRHGMEPAVPYSRENAKRDAEGRAVFSGRYEGVALRGGHGTVDAPGVDDLVETVLRPGDALYLPPGTWHEAEACSHSVAVSLSPPRMHAYDLVLRWLEAQSLARPEWFVDRVAAESDRDSVQPVLHDIVEALQALDPAVLEQQWMMRVAEGQTSGPPSAGPAIEKSTWLVREEAIPWFETEGALVFAAAGVEWRLPVAARPFLSKLVSCTRFRADEVLAWDPQLGWDDARALLQELRDAGVLSVSL